MKTSFQLRTLARLSALALLTTAATAHAAAGDVTRGAVAVTSSMGQYNNAYALQRLIDQSGLSANYDSGTTTFDDYVATATNNTNSSNSWYAKGGNTTGFVSFDLGTVYYVDALALFGAVSSQRVNSIKVYSDDDNDAANGNTGLLFTSGNFALPAGSTEAATKPNVFSFSSGASTRYLTLEIVGTVSIAYATLGEVLFREGTAVAAVPEPGTYALMGLGLLAIGYTQRRRTAQR